MSNPETSWQALPTTDEFLVSPGFAGVTVLVAALIVVGVVTYLARRETRSRADRLEQWEQRRREDRADQQREAAIRRCWERLVWLVDTAGAEPLAADANGSALGLGPEMALELLHGLQRDAEKLGDDTLIRTVSVYLTQFGLVLGWHGGPLPESAGQGKPPVPAGPTGPAKQAAPLGATMAKHTTTGEPPGPAGKRDAPPGAVERGGAVEWGGAVERGGPVERGGAVEKDSPVAKASAAEKDKDTAASTRKGSFLKGRHR